MKTKVKTESTFIVKPEDRIIICEMKADMQLPLSNIFYYDYHYWETKVPEVDPFGKFKVITKTRCSPNDTFNEVIGKRIAESKAKAKVFKTAKNVWNCIAKSLADSTKMAETMAKNCKIVEEIEVKHIEKLSK